MSTTLTEAARVYLTEHTLLEKARRELHEALDAIWSGAWERTKPELERMAGEYGAGISLWPNDSNPGHYEVSTKGKVRRLPAILVIRDPRVAREGEGIEIVLYMRATERRDPALTGERNRFEDICRDEAMGMIEWRKSSEIWMKTVPIVDDLERSAESLAEEMLTVLRAVTRFEAETQG
jgi:hypothetical protein